jgi:hypothetical protein
MHYKCLCCVKIKAIRLNLISEEAVEVELDGVFLGRRITPTYDFNGRENLLLVVICLQFFWLERMRIYSISPLLGASIIHSMDRINYFLKSYIEIDQKVTMNINDKGLG